MTPHCILTEPSMSEPRLTHSRKGREGKGIGRETFQDQSHHLAVGAGLLALEAGGA